MAFRKPDGEDVILPIHLTLWGSQDVWFSGRRISRAGWKLTKWTQARANKDTVFGDKHHENFEGPPLLAASGVFPLTCKGEDDKPGFTGSLPEESNKFGEISKSSRTSSMAHAHKARA